MRSGSALALAIAVTLVFTACDRDTRPSGRIVLGDEAADPLPGAIRTEIDAGNAAFRARDFAAARAHYTKATELDADVFAGWYGLAMAAEAQGDLPTAIAARSRAQELAGGAPIAPHPNGADPPHGF